MIQLSGSSIYMPPDLTDTPVYVVGHRFGIISGVFTVNLKQNDEGPNCLIIVLLTVCICSNKY